MFSDRMTGAAKASHWLAACTLLIVLAGCGQGSALNAGNPTGSSGSNSAHSSAPAAEAKPQTNDCPVYGFEVVNVYPHDPAAFTQGLVFLEGVLFESTGLYGKSSLRKVELPTGKVLQQVEVSAQFFAEGLANLDDKFYQLTWQNQKGFIYDRATFRQVGEFKYTGEGWGLATDGRSLIMSDGTPQIRFLDPGTFQEQRRITVLIRGQPLTHLNELEYVKGEIFANVWGTDYVVRIDPASGKVVGVVDFRGLLPTEGRNLNEDVLNGIAYDSGEGRLFVTGKRWSKLFEVRLKLRQ